MIDDERKYLSGNGMERVTIYLAEDGTVECVETRNAEVIFARTPEPDELRFPQEYDERISELQTMRQAFLTEAYDYMYHRTMGWADCLEWHDRARALLKRLVKDFGAQYYNFPLQIRLEHPLGSFLDPSAKDIGVLCVYRSEQTRHWLSKICVRPDGTIRSCIPGNQVVFTEKYAECLGTYWKKMNDDVLPQRQGRRSRK